MAGNRKGKSWLAAGKKEKTRNDDEKKKKERTTSLQQQQQQQQQDPLLLLHDHLLFIHDKHMHLLLFEHRQQLQRSTRDAHAIVNAGEARDEIDSCLTCD